MIGRIALYSVFLASVIGLLVVLVIIDQAARFSGEDQPAQTISPLALTTDTWGVFNPKTGELLFTSNEDEVRPIASVTKLFTAIAVMESEKKNEPFTLLLGDVTTEGRSGKLFYGERYTPYQLLFPLLIESSNDAGEALKRALGEEFENSVARTKTNAGLGETKIVDGSGLGTGNVSTVRDLAKLYAYVRKNEPHIFDITELRVYINSHTGYASNNPARSLDSFRGGKNGYTPEAGRTFVGAFTEDDGTDIGIVLLGSSDVLGDLEALLARTPGSGR